MLRDFDSIKLFHRAKFNFLRFLIIQLPVAHIVIFVVLNLIYIEDIQTFDNVILYFVPFIALAVVGGVWGFNISIRMMAPHFVSLKLAQKYFAFQLVLFFCKIQPIFLNAVMKALITTCEGPFTIIVKRHSKLLYPLNLTRFDKFSFQISDHSTAGPARVVNLVHLGFDSLQESTAVEVKRLKLR